MPSAHRYTQSSSSDRPHQLRHSSSQTRFRRLTTFADSPRADSSPTSADTAARIFPVDTPCRYSHGTAASTLAERRTYGGTSDERNVAGEPSRLRDFGTFTSTAPIPVST